MAAVKTTLPLLPASSSSSISDVHAAVFPYFARWRQAFGKVFVYWLGTNRNAAEIIAKQGAKASFGLDDGDEAVARVFQKLQAMLFSPTAW